MKKRYWLDDRNNVRRVLRTLYVICAGFVLVDLVDWTFHLGWRHHEGPGDGLPGYYAAYGFVACALLVLIAKELRKVLMRDEDYYDK